VCPSSILPGAASALGSAGRWRLAFPGSGLFASTLIPRHREVGSRRVADFGGRDGRVSPRRQAGVRLWLAEGVGVRRHLLAFGPRS